MRSLALGRRPAGEVVVDLCAPCHLLWFDALRERPAHPGRHAGTVRRDPRRGRCRPPSHSVPAGLSALCRAAQRDAGPAADDAISYTGVRAAHGRLTPFVQFLREKDFIRPLPPADIARLAAQVKVIRCSGCGAPVDLARDTACSDCGAPIATLDPDALARTVGALEAAAAKRTTIDVDALIDGLAAAQSRQRELDRVAGRRPTGGRSRSTCSTWGSTSSAARCRAERCRSGRAAARTRMK